METFVKGMIYKYACTFSSSTLNATIKYVYIYNGNACEFHLGVPLYLRKYFKFSTSM